MAFRKKAVLLLAHKPDILVVPECECPDKCKFDDALPKPTSVIWYGGNLNKGLGVFSYGNYNLQLLDAHKPRYKTILPIAVTGGSIDFTLFAVWAYNPADKGNVYVGQLWKAINHYKALLANTPVILTGDFNSNTIWDKPRRKGNHSTVVSFLAKRGIHSTYHHHFNQTQGVEQHPTFYLFRHENKPYHLDYCFASNHFMDKLQAVEVGAYHDWKQYSDHKPVMVEFDE